MQLRGLIVLPNFSVFSGGLCFHRFFLLRCVCINQVIFTYIGDGEASRSRSHFYTASAFHVNYDVSRLCKRMFYFKCFDEFSTGFLGSSKLSGLSADLWAAACKNDARWLIKSDRTLDSQNSSTAVIQILNRINLNEMCNVRRGLRLTIHSSMIVCVPVHQHCCARVRHFHHLIWK